MRTIDQVRTAIGVTEEAIAELDRYLQQPKLVLISGIPFHRHVEKDSLLACYLKCVRSVSSLNACLVLLDAGYSFEVHTLCRTINECAEDVVFLTSVPDGGPTIDQQKMVDEFFKEEWTDPLHPLVSLQPRATVSRQKVHAHIAQLPIPRSNPSDIQAVQKTLHSAYSGFVHGAYGHIMELLDGSGHGYHLRGMLGTPRIEEALYSLATVMHLTMCAVVILAAHCHADSVHADLKTAARRFFADADLGLKGDPKKHMRKMKGKER